MNKYSELVPTTMPLITIWLMRAQRLGQVTARCDYFHDWFPCALGLGLWSLTVYFVAWSGGGASWGNLWLAFCNSFPWSFISSIFASIPLQYVKLAMLCPRSSVRNLTKLHHWVARILILTALFSVWLVPPPVNTAALACCAWRFAGNAGYKDGSYPLPKRTDICADGVVDVPPTLDVFSGSFLLHTFCNAFLSPVSNAWNCFYPSM